MNKYLVFLLSLVAFACSTQKGNQAEEASQEEKPLQEETKAEIIKPNYITDTVKYDTDDPAIWINRENPSESLIIGTDKGDDDAPGGLYVFNLQGKIDRERSITDLQRPNNVDIAYGLPYKNDTIDIAVCTERYTNSIRVFKLPELTPIDGGGIPVFEEDSLRSPMGLALYQRPTDGQIFVIVSRKEGDTTAYLEQHALLAEEDVVKGNLSRKFGKWSGIKEIEAIAVDDQMGYIYYSDERQAVRKYFADPEKGDEEVLHFATENFLEDREGISIYPTSDSTGYLLVSNQSANTFHVYEREGQNEFVAEIPFSTNQSDGSESVQYNFNEEFPEGIFVAMSDNGTFHIYDWRKISNFINSIGTEEK